MLAARRAPTRYAPPASGQRVLLAAALALVLLWSILSAIWLAADAGKRGRWSAALEPASPLAISNSFYDREVCPPELGYGGVDTCGEGRSRASRGR